MGLLSFLIESSLSAPDPMAHAIAEVEREKAAKAEKCRDYKAMMYDELVSNVRCGKPVCIDGEVYMPLSIDAERTCTVVDLTECDDECDTYWNLSCGHRVPSDYFEKPRYCVACGRKVE